MKEELIQRAYELAKERYAAIGVDVEKAMDALQKISLSLHCWQADDVAGFEAQGALTGGIQATGNYPGKARNMEELRQDVLKAASYIPGTHRLNLHEIYGDFGGKFVDRDQVEPAHFESWISTLPLSLIRRVVIFHFLILIKESVISGWSTQNVAVLLPRKWVNARAILVS